MKKSICLAASLFALAFTPVSAQPAPAPPTPRVPAQATPPPTLAPGPQPSGNFNERLQAIISRDAASQNPAPNLTKFNLNFLGGTPDKLVVSIEKATGKPLNAIIPTEDADVQLPPLKMNDVVVPQLFAALEAASRKVVAVQSNPGFGSYQQVSIDYGFKTADSPLSDASIWYFHAEKPSLPPVISTQKICQFYSLSPYLDRGFTVDDITTAIQTGWKMAGVTSPPELNYHKETKLLIAFGGPNELQTIQQVLQTLPQTQYSLPSMEFQMGQLQKQVDQTQKKLNQLIDQLSAPVKSTTPSPEEKSGK